MTTNLDESTPLITKSQDPRKCNMHNMWMKKGMCAICQLDRMKAQNDFEHKYGSNKPPIKLTKK
jgi:hypothetical protein